MTLGPDPAREDAALLRILVAAHSMPWPYETDLSPMETRTLEAASHGLMNRESSEVYGVSAETVKHQMRQAMRKLAAKSRAHAVAKALRAGLIA